MVHSRLFLIFGIAIAIVLIAIILPLLPGLKDSVAVMKLRRIALWVAGSFAVIVLLLPILPTLMLASYALFSPRDARPEITRGEFPFRIEYKVDGVTHIVEDTLIVEFAGRVFDTGGMRRSRRWTGRMSSDGEVRRFWFPFYGTEVHFVSGSAGYYMGEFNEEALQSRNFIQARPHIHFRNTAEARERGVILPTERIGDGRTFTRTVLEIEEAREILAQYYGIVLISVDLPEPIINNFERRNRKNRRN